MNFLVSKALVFVLAVCLFGQTRAAGNCQQPLYILPIIGGVGAVELAGLKGAPAGFSSQSAIKATLEKLEPGGAVGRVQVGYTLPLPLLTLFRKEAGHWVFDDERLQFYINVIKDVDRPVAVVLLANHFSDASPLIEDLAHDDANFMTLADGSRPVSRYFSTTIWPFTLSADPKVPVNQFRFLAMRKALEALAQVDKANPARLVAVTLGGETHHLFNDLRGGAGVFQGAKYTDYSPLAQEEFRTWLKSRYKGIDDFNRVAGTRFSAWREVSPPSKDVRVEKLDGFFQHYDAYASGHFPVYGWVHSKHMPASIEIWVDGWHVGNATYGVNRQDVYEARPDVVSASVGYRYDLDYSRLGYGEHVLQVVVNGKAKSGLLSETRFSVMTPDQGKPQRPWWRSVWAILLRKMNSVGGIDGWADAPRDMADFYFNPFAKIWQEFREHQVSELINAYARIGEATRINPGMLYSHQLQPWWNGSWNDVLFATGRTPGENRSIQPGVTLYGGLTTNSSILSQHANGRRYGVPEINMLSRGFARENASMFRFHLDNCAKFISPYYFDILPVRLRHKDDHNKMLVAEDAPSPGGRETYSALKELATQ